MLIVFISLILYRDKPEGQAVAMLIGIHRARRGGLVEFRPGSPNLDIQFTGDTNLQLRHLSQNTPLTWFNCDSSGRGSRGFPQLVNS
jgi:hypothetical protein